jgi:SOS-response transcriptional repressor LexA
MMDDWAKRAIDASGKSQAEIARLLSAALHRSLDRAAVNKVYKGTRKLAADEMVELARITGVEIPETGAQRLVPLVGYVSAGALSYFHNPDGPIDWVPAMDGATPDTVAAEIRGDSLGSLFDQWLVYYDEVRRPVTPDLIGKLCVVGLPDDRTMVKKIQRSKTPGLFHLLSNTEAPIMDVEIVWAARVKNMVPR